jgi:nucleolar protein 9
MFFSAALTEISGNERQLATDPECSIILERIIFSMDDFARRVFADSLAGS